MNRRRLIDRISRRILVGIKATQFDEMLKDRRRLKQLGWGNIITFTVHMTAQAQAGDFREAHRSSAARAKSLLMKITVHYSPEDGKRARIEVTSKKGRKTLRRLLSPSDVGEMYGVETIYRT